MKRSFILSIFIFSSTLMLVAQTTHEPKGVMRFLHKLGTLIDTMAVKGVDPHYITAPKRPWQVIAKGNVNQSELRMKLSVKLCRYMGWLSWLWTGLLMECQWWQRKHPQLWCHGWFLWY